MEENTESILYTSDRLTMLVKRRLRLGQVEKKDYIGKTKRYTQTLKQIIKDLTKEPDTFKFNKHSVLCVIEQYYKVV